MVCADQHIFPTLDITVHSMSMWALLWQVGVPVISSFVATFWSQLLIGTFHEGFFGGTAMPDLIARDLGW